MNKTSLRLLKYIKNHKGNLNVNIVIKEFYKNNNRMEAYHDLNELKDLGYITIHPICGLTGPVTNIRPFYDSVNSFDFLADLNTAHNIKPTLRGVDYVRTHIIDYYKFNITLFISIVSIILSILSYFK